MDRYKKPINHRCKQSLAHQVSIRCGIAPWYTEPLRYKWCVSEYDYFEGFLRLDLQDIYYCPYCGEKLPEVNI